MSTLDFVPRTLKRRKVDVQNPIPSSEAQNSPGPSSQVEMTMAPLETVMHKPSQKKKKKQQQGVNPSWDLAFLVWLALSDYCLWADGDLRRRVQTGENATGPGDISEEDSAGMPIVDEDTMVVEQDITDEQGYLSLDYLLKQSPVFRLVSELQPYCDAKEITYVNSIRQFAKDVIDVRFIVDPQSSSVRGVSGSRRTRKPQSGYEVRRTDFSSLKDSVFSWYPKSRWDALTVYVENIPIQYAKVPGIGKLVTTFLPASSGSPMKRLQNIVLPPHHQDLPGSIPICKGFALVTLSSENDVQALLEAWPWDLVKHADTHSTELKQDDMSLDKKVNNQSAEEKSAKTSGLRICTKARWEELRAEYLLYRQQLIDEINQYQDEEEAHWQKETMDEARPEDSKMGDNITSGLKRKQPESTARYEGGMHPDSPYPTGCLVFVRHVHLETNKTTLRTLFSRAWTTNNDEIDYIDYSKNMDSCYVRFRTPAQAESFVDYFLSHHISQLSGLDSSGSESSEFKVILPEIVLGKREEVYWEKIPEKVRKQAVEKTMKAVHGPDFGGDSSVVGEEGEGSKRKRRRKPKVLK